MNKQQLAAKIWESANRMRSKIEANEYKDYILGFIFYKYLSDKEEQWLLSEEYAPEDIREYVNEENEETVRSTQRNLGYFIGYKDLFSTWIQMGADFSVDNVRVALSSFTRLISASHKKVFEGIFNTLETGLSKLGDTSKSQTKAVSDLIRLINEIPMHGKQDYDVLGFIYEYLISNFAANAGKKAGEFYTPHEVSLLMSEIVADHLKGRSEIKIYDPTSGSGSLLINIGQTTAKYMEDSNRIRYYAQELKSNTYNLTRMNLVMRGILPDNIVTRNGDTLEEDWPYFDESDPAGTYDPLYVDAVVSNPPYSQRWEPGGKENDPRYSRYGLAPKAKADYAFLLHDLYHLMPDGIMTIVLPHGVLFRGGEEGKNNKLRASDIRQIADTVRYRRNTPRYSRTVSLGEIRQNDYNLNIPRYVDSSEAGEKEDVLSVSGDYGIVNQIEFQGRSFAGASVSNYGVVHAGDIVYTKSPLSSNPYGIIKTNKGKTGIVSTLYAVYHPQGNTCADFVQTYFEQHARMNNYMHPLVNKGAKNDMKVSAENALKGFVSFPKLEEQKAISEMFSVVDHLITLHQSKLEMLKKIKKSMLGKMLV